jgi:hypothetical protein
VKYWPTSVLILAEGVVVPKAADALKDVIIANRALAAELARVTRVARDVRAESKVAVFRPLDWRRLASSAGAGRERRQLEVREVRS